MRSNIVFTSLPLLLVALIGTSAMPAPPNIELKVPPPYLPPQPHLDPGFDAGGLSKKDRRSDGLGAKPHLSSAYDDFGTATGPGGSAGAGASP